MSTIRDILEEKTFFYQPKILVAEWIPFGPNQFDHFVEAISAFKAKEEIFLTDKMDEEPSQAILEVEPNLARVHVAEYVPGERVEFESQIYYKEEEGILQTERVWVSVQSYGLVVYGCSIREVGYENPENPKTIKWSEFVSLDRLARIVTDLLEDTSTLMSTLLSSYQRRILGVVYPRSEEEYFERKKYVMVITNQVIYNNKSLWELVKNEYDLNNLLSPFSPFRNEVQQIIGEIHKYGFLRNGDVYIIGKEGFLLIIRHSKIEYYKEAIELILTLQALDMFHQHMFARIWMIWDQLLDVRKFFFEISEKPAFLSQEKGEIEGITSYKKALSTMLSDVIILYDVDQISGLCMNMLQRKLDNKMKKEQDDDVMQLLKAFDVSLLADKLSGKIKMTHSVLEALKMDIEGLISVVSTFAEEEMRRVRYTMSENIRRQREIMEIEKMEHDRLRFIEIFSGGLLVAELVSLFLAGLEELLKISLFGFENFIAILSAIFAIYIIRRRSMLFEKEVEEKIQKMK